MHTSYYEAGEDDEYNVIFNHNDDFSGNVIVSSHRAEDGDGGTIAVPFEALMFIVGTYAQRELISRIENEDPGNLIKILWSTIDHERK